jgi:hypothetical protein
MVSVGHAFRSSTTAGITVTLLGTGLSTRTDSRGSFAIRGAPAGKATLHFDGKGTSADLVLPNLHEGKALGVHVTVSGSQATLDCAREVDEREGDNNNGEHEEDIKCGDQHDDHNDGEDGNHEGEGGGSGSNP